MFISKSYAARPVHTIPCSATPARRASIAGESVAAPTIHKSAPTVVPQRPGSLVATIRPPAWLPPAPVCSDVDDVVRAHGIPANDPAWAPAIRELAYLVTHVAHHDRADMPAAIEQVRTRLSDAATAYSTAEMFKVIDAVRPALRAAVERVLPATRVKASVDFGMAQLRQALDERPNLHDAGRQVTELLWTQAARGFSPGNFFTFEKAVQAAIRGTLGPIQNTSQCYAKILGNVLDRTVEAM